MRVVPLAAAVCLSSMPCVASVGWHDAVVVGAPLRFDADEYRGYDILEVRSPDDPRSLMEVAKGGRLDGFRSRLVLISSASGDADGMKAVAEELGRRQPHAKVVRCTGEPLEHLRAHVGISRKVEFPASGRFVCMEREEASSAPVAVTAYVRVKRADNGDFRLALSARFGDGSYSWGHAFEYDWGVTNAWQKGRVMYRPSRKVHADYVSLGCGKGAGEVEFGDAYLLRYLPERLPTLDAWPTKADAVCGGEGYLVRDVAKGDDFAPPGVGFRQTLKASGGAFFHSAEMSDGSGSDRALTLVYAVPVTGDGAVWWDDTRTPRTVSGEEAVVAKACGAGTGDLSRWPIGAVTAGTDGVAIGIDPESPAIYRIGFSPAHRALYIAYDLGLAPERPSAAVRFAVFRFDGVQGFRGAFARYMELYPEAFKVRIPRHGGWMAFERMSEIPDVEDFGIAYKESDNETAWDDAHGVYTFRYHESGTWWMALAGRDGAPPTYAAALAHADALIRRGDRWARAWRTSGFRDAFGRPAGVSCNRNWCKGYVWSMNPAPGIKGDITEFSFKQGDEDFRRNYAKPFPEGIDGEYVDSSEMFATAPLDFDRSHFAGMATPLAFSPSTGRPAVYKGLACQEYCAATARRLRKAGRFLFANSTPDAWSWLVPQLDVVGNEMDWFREGKWTPPRHSELVYRRALAGGKPLIMLMNIYPASHAEELTERYFALALAYGIIPSFEPVFYRNVRIRDRERPLCRKYMPLCRMLSEAGWRPLCRIASCREKGIALEQFGDRFLTVLNTSRRDVEFELELAGADCRTALDLLSRKDVAVGKGRSMRLAAGGVIALDFGSL